MSHPRPYLVLLHGLGRSRLSMAGAARWFRRAGYEVHNVGYPSQRVRVSEAVEKYLQPALAQLTPSPARPVHFLTHSLGGIVVRQWAAQARADFPRGRIVQLAPPNQGSEIIDHLGPHPIVRAVLGPVVHDLGTGPQSLPQLLGAAPPDTGIIMGRRAFIPVFRRWLGPESDGIVRVAGGQLDNLTDFLTLPADHTTIMWQPSVLRAAEHFFQHGKFPLQA